MLDHLHAHLFRAQQYVWPTTRWHTKDGRSVLHERDWKTLTKIMQRIYTKHRIRVSLRVGAMQGLAAREDGRLR